MRIGIVIGELGVYGGQRVALSLAGALAARHEVTIVTFENARHRELVPEGVRHVHVSRRRRGLVGTAGLIFRLRHLFRSCGFTHVLAVMSYANIVSMVASLRLRNAPRMVVSEHSVTSEAITQERRPRLMRWLMVLLYARSSALVAVSDATMADLMQMGIRAKAVRRIYNPVELPTEADDVDPEHNWLAPGHQGRTLVVCGNLKPAKGYHIAVSALEHLPEDHRLVVVGEGPLLDDLRRQARRGGVEHRVAFVGRKSNPHPWIRAADAVVIPSLWEGFGLVAVEAARAGRPIVATRVGGLAEVGRIVGASLVEPGNPVALARAIVHILQSAGGADSAGSTSLFHPSFVATEYEALFMELAGEPGGNTV
jgi:glycosyltransferase involved in cell wall biosynthesis